MISALPDPLASALAVIDEQQAQIWELRIALVAALSMEARIARLEQAHGLAPFSPPSSPGVRPNAKDRDARIVEVLSAHGPLSNADVTRMVSGRADLSASERNSVNQSLHRLRREGQIVQLEDRRYAIPPVEASVAAGEEASV